ncbi:hypothetical protein E4T48_00738 [Aureobasidium sp. EXF-10727]|nr:hypothetical protein E4T48_00738 [Aureobasidium sp. EXF-10727]
MKLYGNEEDYLIPDDVEEGRNREDDSSIDDTEEGCNTEDNLSIDCTFEERIERAQTKMGDRTAFFYGTLMAKEVLYNVIFGTSSISRYNIQTVTQTPAILHDHKRSRVKHCDYPGVIPEKGHSVRGTYVTGLTDGDIYRLDMFEGTQYSLRTVRVKLLTSEGDAATGSGNVEGDEVETQTYIWTAKVEYLEDKEWDYAAFRKEKLAMWSGGEPEEQGWDDEETIDPTGGRFGNGQIAQNLSKEHEKLKQQEGNDGEPLKSAV